MNDLTRVLAEEDLDDDDDITEGGREAGREGGSKGGSKGARVSARRSDNPVVCIKLNRRGGGPDDVV